MGIKINELVTEVKRSVTFENLLNKKIAIDAFNALYQFLAIIRQYDGSPLMDQEGNVTSHLSGLFYRNINFLEHDIKPIYVFDGEASELKLETIKERKEIKESAKKKMIEAQDRQDFKEAKKQAQLTSKLNTEMINESKKLLAYMGLPIFEASSEGEAQSSYLVNNGDAWACASQDYDTLLFGCKRLIRNFAVSRKKKVRDTTDTLDIEYISLSKFLENLGINREQLIDMGILIGTDFYQGIKGIGQHKALELIKKHGSLKNIINNKVKILGKLPEFDMELVESVRFLFLNPDVKKEYPPIKWKKIRYDKVKELLVEQHDFSEQRVDNALDRLRKKASSKKQISLGEFIKK